MEIERVVGVIGASRDIDYGAGCVIMKEIENDAAGGSTSTIPLRVRSRASLSLSLFAVREDLSCDPRPTRTSERILHACVL